MMMSQRRSSNASDYILNLVVKNVTKDTPLSNEEVQILKAFRDQLTSEQWNTWLQVARKEKKRRKEMESSATASVIISSSYNDIDTARAEDGTFSSSNFLARPESYISSDTSQKTAETKEVPVEIAGLTHNQYNSTENAEITFNPTPLNSINEELLRSDDLFDDFKLLEISDVGSGEEDPFTLENDQIIESDEKVESPKSNIPSTQQLEMRIEDSVDHTSNIKSLEMGNNGDRKVSYTNPIETVQQLKDSQNSSRFGPIDDLYRAQPSAINGSDDGDNQATNHWLDDKAETEISFHAVNEDLVSIYIDSYAQDSANTFKPTPWGHTDSSVSKIREHPSIVTASSDTVRPNSAGSVAAAKKLWEERLLPKQVSAVSSQTRHHLSTDHEMMPPPRQLQVQNPSSSLNNPEKISTPLPVQVQETPVTTAIPSPYAPPRPLNAKQTMPVFRQTNAYTDDYQSDSNATDESIQSQQSFYSVSRIADVPVRNDRTVSTVKHSSSSSSSTAKTEGSAASVVASTEVSLRIVRHARSSTPKRTPSVATDSSSVFSASLPEPQQVPSQLFQQVKHDDDAKKPPPPSYYQPTMSTQTSSNSAEHGQSRPFLVPRKVDAWTAPPSPPPPPSPKAQRTNQYYSSNSLFFDPPGPPQFQGTESVEELSSKDSVTTTLPQLRRKSTGRVNSHPGSAGYPNKESSRIRRPDGVEKIRTRKVEEEESGFITNSSNGSKANGVTQYSAFQDRNADWDRERTTAAVHPPSQRALSPPHPIEMLAAKQRVWNSATSMSTSMQPLASQSLQDSRQLFENRGDGEDGIALSSARHLDAACTAAKSLLTSFQGPPHQSRAESRDLDSKMSVLSEMINSLESSKDAIAQLLQAANKRAAAAEEEPAAGPVDWDQYYSERGRRSGTGVRYVNEDPMPSPRGRFHDEFQWEEGDEFDDNTSMSTSSARPNGGSINSGRRQGANMPSIGTRWNTGDWSAEDRVDEQEVNFQDYFFSDANLRGSENEVKLSESFRGQGLRQSEMKHSRPSSSSRTTAICLAQGALVAAFDDFPIRTNIGSASVDVVWRENIITTPIPVPIPRNSPLRRRRGSSSGGSRGLGRSSGSHGNKSLRGRSRSRSRSPSSSYPSYPFSSTVPSSSSSAAAPSSNIPSKSGSVLRRERFLFDDVLAGPYANRDLTVFVRKRCRQALSAGDDMAVLCLACGESVGSTSLQSISELPLEPSVGLLLGSGGGSGLLHAVVSEVLRCLGGHSEKSLQQSFNGDLPLLPNSPHLVISAVVIPTNTLARASTSVIDLFSVAKSRTSSEKASAGLRVRRDNGKVELVGVKRLQLHSSSDVDRLAGLLLGTRSAALQLLAHHCRGTDDVLDVNSSSDSLNSVGAAAAASSDCGGTMMLQLGIKGGVGRSRLVYTFSLLAPCGPTWSCPGIDIDILTECMASAAHTSPPSLLKLSPLTSLLMGGPQKANPLQLLTVVSVHRCQAPRQQPSGKVKPVEVLKAAEQDHVMLQDSLRMLKIACRHVMQ